MTRSSPAYVCGREGYRCGDGSSAGRLRESAGAWDPLHAELDEIDPTDVTALARKAKRAREIVYGAGLPDDLAAEIDLERAERARREAEHVLEGGFVEPADLASARAALQRALVRIRVAERGARRPRGEHEAIRPAAVSPREEPPGE